MGELQRQEYQVHCMNHTNITTHKHHLSILVTAQGYSSCMGMYGLLTLLSTATPSQVDMQGNPSQSAIDFWLTASVRGYDRVVYKGAHSHTNDTVSETGLLI